MEKVRSSDMTRDGIEDGWTEARLVDSRKLMSKSVGVKLVDQLGG